MLNLVWKLFGKDVYLLKKIYICKIPKKKKDGFEDGVKIYNRVYCMII